jgi:hypothetical protein
MCGQGGGGLVCEMWRQAWYCLIRTFVDLRPAQPLVLGDLASESRSASSVVQSVSKGSKSENSERHPKHEDRQALL